MDLPIQISPSHFEKINQLGSGTIGKVYLAKEKSTQQEYAIKFVKTELTSNSEIIQYINEISQIYHPTILRPFGYSLPDHSKKRPMSLVTEFKTNGSLSLLIQHPNEFTDFRKLKILFGVAEGLRFLHENHLVHGDLTPGNILLNENLEPVLTDYSLSKLKPRKTRIPQMNICFYSPENDITEITASARDESSESSSESPVMTTKQYTILDNFQDIEPSADVFSYGMIVYTVITESYPYTEEESKDIAIRIKQGERPPLIDSIPENWQMLISQCWNPDPTRRPTFESIVLRFLKNEFSFPMKSFETIQLHNYQSSCLSPSFATTTLISTLDQIKTLTDSNRNLTRMVETLRKNFDSLAHNVAQMQTAARDPSLPSSPNGFSRPNLQRRMSVKPSSKAFLEASLYTPTSKDTNSTTFEFPRLSRPTNDDNSPQHKKNPSSVVFKDTKPNVTFNPIQNNPNEKKEETEVFPKVQQSSLKTETGEKQNKPDDDLSPFPTFGTGSKKLQRINPAATLSGSSLPPVDTSHNTPFPSIRSQSNIDQDTFPSIKSQSSIDQDTFPSINSQSNNNQAALPSMKNNDEKKDDVNNPINLPLLPNMPIPPQLDELPIPVPPQQRQNSFIAQPAQMQQIPTNKPRLSLQPSNGPSQRTRSKTINAKRKSGFGFDNSNSTAPTSPLSGRKSSKISSQMSLDSLIDKTNTTTPTKQFNFGAFSTSSNDSPVMPLSQSSKKLKKSTSQREVSNAPLQFPYAYSPFDGIFAHLTQEVGGNLVEKGVINIIGNSADKNRENSIHEIVNFDWDRCWTSANVPNSFIQFDFGMHQVYITHYTIKTYPCGRGYSHLKNWAIEGFIDGQWYEIDRRDDNNELNGKSKVATFQVAANGEFTSIRLRQTGPNHYGDNYLILSNIELFGDFI